VLAVDPSSKVSGGSILGDKTRMAELAAPRRSPHPAEPGRHDARGVAGGRREALLLCEAAGFDIVVGSEPSASASRKPRCRHDDLLILLVQPGGGDRSPGYQRASSSLPTSWW